MEKPESHLPDIEFFVVDGAKMVVKRFPGLSIWGCLTNKYSWHNAYIVNIDFMNRFSVSWVRCISGYIKYWGIRCFLTQPYIFPGFVPEREFLTYSIPFQYNSDSAKRFFKSLTVDFRPRMLTHFQWKYDLSFKSLRFIWYRTREAELRIFFPIDLTLKRKFSLSPAAI